VREDAGRLLAGEAGLFGDGACECGLGEGFCHD